MLNLIAKAIETQLDFENVSVLDTFKTDCGTILSLVYFEVNFYGNVEKHNSIFELVESDLEVVGQNSLLFQNNIKPLEEFENSEIIDLFNCIKNRESLEIYQD